MKLERLYIQGFKSFKDRTTIEFDDGITGIVGPNGCGKSNIVDALFWVMGEQSAKHLRGSKMSDLIFSGTNKYNPASFAEVTLVLSNSEGKHIHIGDKVVQPGEIQLTRKLYRNGETEYRINDVPARLRDIQEVFMDTGAGAKSYSIIAQGEIDRLVRAKPEERRTMIEEVAGITKFKMRKKESLRKIEQTQLNLERLGDLEKEVYKQLKSLEKQSEKAARARVLKDKMKHHELIVSSHKERDLLDKLRQAAQKNLANQMMVEQWNLRKSELDISLEEEKNNKLDLMDKIDANQSQYNEKSKILATNEEKLKFLIQTMGEKNKYILDKENENQVLGKDWEARVDKLDYLNEQLKKLEASSFEEEDYSALEEQVENLREKLQSLQIEESSAKEEKEDLRKDFQKIENDLYINSSKLEEYSKTLQEIAQEIDSLEKDSSNFTDDLSDRRDRLKELEKLVAEYKEKKDALMHAQQKEKETLNQKDQKARELSKSVASLNAQYKSVVEMSESFLFEKNGTKDFIRNNSSQGFSQLVNLIEVEDKYSKVVERLLSAHLESIIHKDDKIDSFDQWLANNKTDLDFLLINELHADGFLSAEDYGLVELKSILKIKDSSFEHKLNILLDGFYICEKLSPLMVSQFSSKNFKGISNLDGSMVVSNYQGIIKFDVSADEDKRKGILDLKNQVTKIEEDLQKENQKLMTLESEIKVHQGTLEMMQTELAFMAQEWQKCNDEYIALKSQLLTQENSLNSSHSRLQILQKKKTEMSHYRLDMLEREEVYQEDRDKLHIQINELEEKLLNIDDQLSNMKMNFESKREELLEKKANSKTYENQLSILTNQVQDIEDQILKLKEREAANVEKIKNLNDEIESAKLSLSEINNENMNLSEQLSSEKEILSVLKDDLSELLIGMQDREDELKKINRDISELEKEQIELEMKMNQYREDESFLTRDIFERHKVDLRKSLSVYLELGQEIAEQLKSNDDMYLIQTEEGTKEIIADEFIFEKRFPGQVSESAEKFKSYKSEFNRIGEINWQAIEDYDRQKIRHDFLKKQEEELKSSINDLMMAINQIDEKSKKRFQTAFEEVNDKFTKVFPIIFGGGAANLHLTGSFEDAEAGVEIIAQPPGKKMQNINLMSGGEKALTAVSLIFSIFLVKPSPFCLLDEVDAPLDDANVGRFNELLREMSSESQFILITHNKKTMELNDTLYGVTMQEAGVSTAVSVQLH